MSHQAEYQEACGGYHIFHQIASLVFDWERDNYMVMTEGQAKTLICLSQIYHLAFISIFGSYYLTNQETKDLIKGMKR